MSKVLVLTNNPSRPSFRQRIGNYLDGFAEHGIHCTVRVFPKSLGQTIVLLKECRNYDAVLLHKKRMNPVNAHFLKRYAKRILYDFDDAVMYNEHHPEKYSYKRQSAFRRTVGLADTVTCGNAYLARHAKQHNKNVHIVPTGLNLKNYFSCFAQSAGDKIRLVWIGSKATLRYLKDLADILDELGLTYSNLVLRIIADDFFDLRNMPVEKIPWSLQTQAKHLSECDIGLAPLNNDPYTQGKCGFKILQYHAGGLPVVADPVGFNGEYIKDGINGFLADSPVKWKKKLSELIHSEPLRKQMGEQGREDVREFDQPVIQARLLAILEETLSR